jgi:hypothetical protein
VFKFRSKISLAREKVVLDLDNIEQLFGLVEMSCRLGFEDPDVRDSTVHMIAETLEQATRPDNYVPPINFRHDADVLQKMGHVPEGVNKVSTDLRPLDCEMQMYDFFGPLAAGRLDDPGRKTSRSDCIITFNYDRVCDRALSRLGIRTDYHLPPDYVHDDARDDSGPACSLLKLHGSANWVVCKKCHKSIQIGEDGGGSVDDRMEKCPFCNVEYAPLLVPPSWDKTGYSDVMTPVWKKAIQELTRATRICIIGYSMPESDAYFKYLLTVALAGNAGLYKFVVVDNITVRAKPSVPSLGETVEKRYKKLLDPLFVERRFVFHGQGVWTFLRSDAIHTDLGRAEFVKHF